MKIYEMTVVCICFLLTAFFVWRSLQAFRWAGSKEELKPHRRQALLLLALGCMFLSAALFVLFRIPAFLGLVCIIGTLSAAFAIGDGLRDNMWKHGGN